MFRLSRFFGLGLLLSPLGALAGDGSCCVSGICVVPVCAPCCAQSANPEQKAPKGESQVALEPVAEPTAAPLASKPMSELPLSEGTVLQLGDIRCQSCEVVVPTGPGESSQTARPVPSYSAPRVSLLARFRQRQAENRERRRQAWCRFLGCQ